LGRLDNLLDRRITRLSAADGTKGAAVIHRVELTRTRRALVDGTTLLLARATEDGEGVVGVLTSTSTATEELRATTKGHGGHHLRLSSRALTSRGLTALSLAVHSELSVSDTNDTIKAKLIEGEILIVAINVAIIVEGLLRDTRDLNRTRAPLVSAAMALLEEVIDHVLIDHIRIVRATVVAEYAHRILTAEWVHGTLLTELTRARATAATTLTATTAIRADHGVKTRRGVLIGLIGLIDTVILRVLIILIIRLLRTIATAALIDINRDTTAK
jgi:hypothetical protein